jgi:hypothetical protein
LNLAFGYEADRMIGEKEENFLPNFTPKLEKIDNFTSVWMSI